MMILNIFLKRTCVLFPVILLILSAGCNNNNTTPETIPVTVVVLKEAPGSSLVDPEVRLEENGKGCSVRYEEGWTGETPAEFYFTVDVPSGNEKAPVVAIDMKGTKIRRIMMPGIPEANYEDDGNMIRLALVKQEGNIRHLWSDWTDEERTDVQFPWNWTERREGPHAADSALHISRNLAHIAYAIGAREVFREWDITRYLNENFPGRGDAAAIGYENNFPRRHEDYPPHIHIWFKWPDWRGYNTHLYMDDSGRIDSCWVITPGGVSLRPRPGEWQEKKDDRERTVFLLRYTDEGSVEIKKTAANEIYSLQIDNGNVKELTVSVDGKPFKRIRIVDFDPTVARIIVETCDLRTGKLKTETLVTDRDLGGGKREITESICK